MNLMFLDLVGYIPGRSRSAGFHTAISGAQLHRRPHHRAATLLIGASLAPLDMLLRDRKRS